MAITFYWDAAEQNLAIYELGVGWTWGEMRQVMQDSWDEYGAHAIVDALIINMGSEMPSGAMPHLRALSANRPENTGLLIFVGATPLVRSMMQTLSKLYSAVIRREITFSFAKTTEEARAMLAQKRLERNNRVR